MRFLPPLLLALLLPAAPCPAATAPGMLADFTLPGTPWRPGTASPRPVRGAQDPTRIAFAFTPSATPDRVYWDFSFALAAQPGDCLQFDAWCTDPGVIDRIALHLRSGPGWYSIPCPIRHNGWNRWNLPLGGFSPSERPTAITAATTVRIAIHPRPNRGGELSPSTLRLIRPSVMVVRATSSLRDPADRSAAESSLGLVTRWLDLAGIPYGILDDDQVAAGHLKGARMAFFPCNPHPAKKQVDALRAFVAAGGRMVAWVPESPEWASLLQVTDVQRVSTRNAGRFNTLSFVQDGFAPVHDPVWNILQARPAAKSGVIAAWWKTATGTTLSHPAVIQTPAGWWFSGPPRAGDPLGKSQMLTRIATSHIPSLWRDAATHAILYADPSIPGVPLRLGPAREAFARGDHPAAWKRAQEARREHEKAYAASRPAVPGGIRAVWDHNAVGLEPGAWKTTCDRLARNGINTVFSNVLWPGRAHCALPGVPPTKTYEAHGDQLKQLLDAARPHGIAVHAWKVCWNLSGAPEEQLAPLRRKGLLQQTADGRDLPWLSPCQPENWRSEINAMLDLAARYPVQGIHLDYVRFPDRLSCYSPATRRRFEEYTGKKAPDWPKSVQQGGSLWPTYARFRAAQMDQFVRMAAKELRAKHPRLQISIAVWGKYPDCVDAVGQDWPVWLKEGLVDFVCPMNYFENAWDYESILREQLALPGAKGKIIPGIGVTANECELYPSEVLRQIAITSRNGCPGFALFRLDSNLLDNTLPVLEPALRK